MNSEKNTVIFDLDGTLLNTLEDLTDSVNYVMELHGCPTHSLQAVRMMVGNGIYLLMERALPGGRDNPAYEDCMAEFQDYYKTHMQVKTAPFPGIQELLATLSQEGYGLAVVSNKFDQAVKKLCPEYFGSLISVAIGENEAAGIAKKPAPDTVFAAMKELGADPSECVYVGDSDVDLETARNAGIPCISVTWGFREEDFLREHGAQFLVSDTTELLRQIQEL